MSRTRVASAYTKGSAICVRGWFISSSLVHPEAGSQISSLTWRGWTYVGCTRMTTKLVFEHHRSNSRRNREMSGESREVGSKRWLISVLSTLQSIESDEDPDGKKKEEAFKRKINPKTRGALKSRCARTYLITFMIPPSLFQLPRYPRGIRKRINEE